MPIIERRLVFIDSLRGIAAIFVMLHHYFNYILPIKYFNPFEYGYLGVQLFFIISGFVIFWTVERSLSTKKFLISRICRLYPGYWLNVCITFTLILVFSYNNKHYTYSDLLVNLTMFQHWFLVPDIDLVYWSLAVELNFYIIIIIILLLKQLDKIYYWGLVGICVTLICSLLKRFFDIPIYFISPLLHYWHLFFAGILFYKIYSGLINKITIGLLLVCLISQWLLVNKIVENFIVSGFFLLLFFLSSKRMIFPEFKPLIWFGTISYSVYLFHQVNGQIIYRNLTFILDPSIRFMVVVSIVIFCSYFITFQFEKPVQIFVKHKVSTIGIGKK